MFYPTPSSSESSNLTILSADRLKCPVCGSAHGDCTGDTKYQGGINFIAKKENDPRATFRVPKRIYEETTVNGRKRRKLLYAKGAAITPEEAKRLGLLPK